MEDKISLVKAWSAFWSHPKKWEFILTWIGLYIAIFAVSFILNLLTVIPIIGFVLMCVLIPLILVFEFAAMFFILAYIYEIADSVRLGKVEFPKILDKYKERLSFGLKLFLVEFVYNLPTVAIFTFLYVLFIVGMIALGASTGSGSPEILSFDPSTGSWITALLSAFIVILIILAVSAVAVLNRFLVDSAVYKFLASKRDLAMGFKFNSAFQIFKKGFKQNLSLFWQKFLLCLIVTGIVLVLMSPAIILFIFSMGADRDISSILGVAAMCFYILGIVALYALIVPVSYYIYPHLLGQMYKIWDKKGLDKV